MGDKLYYKGKPAIFTQFQGLNWILRDIWGFIQYYKKGALNLGVLIYPKDFPSGKFYKVSYVISKDSGGRVTFRIYDVKFEEIEDDFKYPETERMIFKI